MDTNFEHALNQLNLANPASSSARGQSVVPNFAKINKTRSVRQLSIGLALFACIAIPTAASIAMRGGINTNVQFADESIDGLKSAAKKSGQNSQSVQSGSLDGAQSQDLGASPTEVVGADQNFRASRDGFSFANYGGKPTNDVIDATTMIALFGKASVCADQNAALCVMVPGAQAMADQLNEAMTSGRCEGMAVLAQRYFYGLEERPNGATTTAQITQNQVARQIGYWWATQVAPPVANTSAMYRAMTPTQIISELVKGLKDRTGFTLGLYSQFGGHSVNPIAVTKDGGNFNIYVYDNNYPNQIRKVVVNTATESWTYGAAALNSSSAASTWTGSGAGSFDLTPMAARQGPFKVSFGATNEVKGSSYSVIVTQQGNTTEPVGFKLSSRFGEINSLDTKSVSNANFPIKSFLGAGVGQGVVAFIPTELAEGSGLDLEIVGGDKYGKFKFSVMKAGSAGVVVESQSKFDLSVSNSASQTDYGINLLNTTDKASVQLSSGNSATDIQLSNGQSIEMSTTAVADNTVGSSRQTGLSSAFELSSFDGKVLISEKLETDLPKGQVQKVNLSVDSSTGAIARDVVQVKGVKVDNNFIKEIVENTSKIIYEQPIQLPTRANAGATTTTSLVPDSTPSSVPESTTIAPAPIAISPPATPTTLPAQKVEVTVRALRFYGNENKTIQAADWNLVSCVDTSSARTGCSLLEETIKTTPWRGLMQMNVNLDQMAVVEKYSSRTSADLSAVMSPVASMPSNYTAEVIVELEVVKKPLAVIVEPNQSKVYGDDDPRFDFVTEGLMKEADLTGELSRAVGEDVNVDGYEINQGKLAATSNYDLTLSGSDRIFRITPKPITVTAAAVSKTYGAADPTFTFAAGAGELVGTDVLSGVSVARVSGESVGPYVIEQGSVTAGNNYTINYVPANLTINKKPITVTAAAVSKTYGAADPVFTFAAGAGELVGTDVLSGVSVARVSGESVGPYVIEQGSVTAGNNYTINYVPANLTIEPKPITVSAAAKLKTYGDADPALTIKTIGLEEGDTLTGALTRVVGEDVKTYAIEKGTLGNSNYLITFTSANLTIEPKPITVTAAAQTKVYGAADPVFMFAAGTGDLVRGDVLSGLLARPSTTTSENVGPYAIEQGSIETANPNYDITFRSAELTIEPKPITVTAAAVSKTYGTVDPTFTFAAGAGELVGTDVLSGVSVARVSGESVGPYVIEQGSVTAGNNYTINYVPANLTINKKPITVTAAAKSKTYGDADPVFTFAAGDGELVGTDVLSGVSVARVSGESVGPYVIEQGLVTAGSNYTINYVPANLTINKKRITVTAQDVVRKYGQSDPEFKFAAGTGDLVGTDVLKGSLSRTDSSKDVGEYEIGVGSIQDENPNYAIDFIEAKLTIEQRDLTVSVDKHQTKVFGDKDPTFTYSAPQLISGDTLTGALARVTGEGVNTYAINLGTLANANYNITFKTDVLTITPKALVVTVDKDQRKVFGDKDPIFTYSAPQLILGDTLTGALARVTGEDVKTYAINLGTLANANYAITFKTDVLTITPKALTVTAQPTSKTYGVQDPALEFETIGLETGDTLTGALTRVVGEDVKTYAIEKGTLSANSNYTLNFNGAFFTIEAKPITVTADAASKTYGDADPVFTFAAGAGDLVGTDVLKGSLSRIDSSSDVGKYEIGVGSIQIENPNYVIEFTSDVLMITPKPLQVAVGADRSIKVGKTTLATATYEGGGAVTWSSEGSCTNDDGLVTGTAKGKCTITATVDASKNYQAGVVSLEITIN